jgi:hypothetical protein
VPVRVPRPWEEIMFLRRVVLATTAAVLILAAPAAASTAAAGPSPTPLILELILAAFVIAGMAIRRPVSRAVANVRGKLTRPQSRPARRAVERRA